MILRSTLMPKVKEACVASQRKYKIYITYPLSSGLMSHLEAKYFQVNVKLYLCLAFFFIFIFCVLAALVIGISST